LEGRMKFQSKERARELNFESNFYSLERKLGC
jgi:hypothetical protein